MYNHPKTSWPLSRLGRTNTSATDFNRRVYRHQYYGQDMSGMPAYQQRNWLLAYRTYRFLQERDQLPQLSPKDLADSQDLQVPVRMERLKVGSKTIVMDGAHNAQKMEAFCSKLSQTLSRYPASHLISLKQGKDFQVWYLFWHLWPAELSSQHLKQRKICQSNRWILRNLLMHSRLFPGYRSNNR